MHPVQSLPFNPSNGDDDGDGDDAKDYGDDDGDDDSDDKDDVKHDDCVSFSRTTVGDDEDENEESKMDTIRLGSR